MNRKAYADESVAVLKKQKKILDQLRKDNEKLRADIFNHKKYASTHYHCTWRFKEQEQAAIAGLKGKLDKLQQRHARALKRLTETKEQVNALRLRISQQRNNLGGVDAARTVELTTDRHVHRLTKKAEAMLAKLNEALDRQKRLKLEMKDLQRERLTFTQLQERLQRSLDEKQLRTTKIIDACNKAYEARDRAKAEKDVLIETNRRETLEHGTKLQELNEMLETETRRKAMRPALPMFGADEKGRERGERQPARPSSPSKMTSSRGLVVLTGFEREERVRKQAEVKQLKREIEKLEAWLGEVREVTGWDDLEVELAAFTEREEQLFDLATRINHDEQKEIQLAQAQVALYRTELAAIAAAMQEEGADSAARPGGIGHDGHEKHRDAPVREERHPGPQPSDVSWTSAKHVRCLQAVLAGYEERGATLQGTLDTLVHGVHALTLATFPAPDKGGDTTEANVLARLARVEARMEAVLRGERAHSPPDVEGGDAHTDRDLPTSTPTQGSSLAKILRFRLTPPTDTIEPRSGATPALPVPPLGGGDHAVVAGGGCGLFHHPPPPGNTPRVDRGGVLWVQVPGMDDPEGPEEGEEAPSPPLYPPTALALPPQPSLTGSGAALSLPSQSPFPPAQAPSSSPSPSPCPLTRQQIQNTLYQAHHHGRALRPSVPSDSDRPSPGSRSPSSASPVPSRTGPAPFRRRRRMSHFFRDWDD